MPAAPSALITALRVGTCVRHMFFKMTHDDGDVLAWDGVGDFDFNGDTYLGVAGLAEIGGVSNSSDIQNHAVTVRLNGVPLSVFRGVSPSIRNQTAELYAVWISTETGLAIASKLVFAGFGDFLTTRLTEETISLTATIRAPHSDWSVVPRAYYTSADQSRLHPGDTGCDYTSALENAVIAGWQSTPASATELLYWRANFSLFRFVANSAGELYGHPTYGPFFQAGADGEMLGADSAQTYKDGVLNNPATYGSLGGPVQCNGVSVQLNGSLNPISADGNIITRAGTGSSGDQPRVIGTISSDGTASTAIRAISAFGKMLPYVATLAPSGEDYSGVLFPASGLNYAVFNSVVETFTLTPPTTITGYRLYRNDGSPYVDSVNGDPIIYNSASPNTVFVYKDNGSSHSLVNCLISTTGVALVSGTGARLIVDGDPESYLRIWT